jgi:hypothetical protein
MRNDLTDLTVVMDRSGSMEAIRSDAQGGLNTFIENQKELPGECLFTLVQFDTEYEFVFQGTPIKRVGKVELVPRGATALLDAVGRAINEAGKRLKDTPEDQRPGLVVFVILTDGQENSSKEFTKAKIKEMVEHQRDKYKWQFTYLGANVDAFDEARQMGIPTSGTMPYQAASSPAAFAAAHANVKRMRRMSAGGQSVANFYTPDEVQAANEPNKEKKDSGQTSSTNP